jgi:hypothetical protein
MVVKRQTRLRRPARLLVSVREQERVRLPLGRLLFVLSERVKHELLDACLRVKPQRWRRGDDSAQWSTLEHKQPTIE